LGVRKTEKFEKLRIQQKLFPSHLSKQVACRRLPNTVHSIRDSFVRQSVFYYSALKKQPKMQTSQTFTSGTQFGVRFYSKTHFFICSKYKNAGYYFDGKLGETLRKKRKWKVSTPQNDSSAHSELV